MSRILKRGINDFMLYPWINRNYPDGCCRKRLFIVPGKIHNSLFYRTMNIRKTAAHICSFFRQKANRRCFNIALPAIHTLFHKAFHRVCWIQLTIRDYSVIFFSTLMVMPGLGLKLSLLIFSWKKVIDGLSSPYAQLSSPVFGNAHRC